MRVQHRATGSHTPWEQLREAERAQGGAHTEAAAGPSHQHHVPLIPARLGGRRCRAQEHEPEKGAPAQARSSKRRPSSARTGGELESGHTERCPSRRDTEARQRHFCLTARPPHLHSSLPAFCLLFVFLYFILPWLFIGGASAAST